MPASIYLGLCLLLNLESGINNPTCPSIAIIMRSIHIHTLVFLRTARYCSHSAQGKITIIAHYICSVSYSLTRIVYNIYDSDKEKNQ